jgi:hypothetical protein
VSASFSNAGLSNCCTPFVPVPFWFDIVFYLFVSRWENMSTTCRHNFANQSLSVQRSPNTSHILFTMRRATLTCKSGKNDDVRGVSNNPHQTKL